MKSIAFDRAVVKQDLGEENAIKLLKYISQSSAEQYLHQVNITLLELDLRMLLYFFRKLSGALSKLCLNYCTLCKTDPFPEIVRLRDYFADYVMGCGKRSIVRNRSST